MGEEQKAAFEHLKELYPLVPTLKQANESQPYVLSTDSSDYAVGEDLLQVFEAENHPICEQVIDIRRATLHHDWTRDSFGTVLPIEVKRIRGVL